MEHPESIVAIYVGIDVSKDRLDGHVRPQGDVFVARLKRLAPTLVVLEATGGYETVVASALAAAGITLEVVNTRRSHDFAKALGRLAKTDRIDAETIARFAETVRPQARLVVNRH